MTLRSIANNNIKKVKNFSKRVGRKNFKKKHPRRHLCQKGRKTQI